MNDSVLLIDNYDSFTFNLVQYFEEIGFVRGQRLHIVRNDAISVQDIMDTPPGAIVLSPGPCTPNEAGICLELVQAAWGTIPLFGVCLGLQIIVQAMGGNIIRAQQVMHGKTSMVSHNGEGVFAGIESPIAMGRYHSLVAEESSLPACLSVSARACDPYNDIMAVRGIVEPVVEAVQFHPESILSKKGHRMLANFLETAFAATILTNYDAK